MRNPLSYPVIHCSEPVTVDGDTNPCGVRLISESADCANARNHDNPHARYGCDNEYPCSCWITGDGPRTDVQASDFPHPAEFIDGRRTAFERSIDA